MDFIFYILSSVYPYGAELENLLTIKTISFNSVSFHELDAGNSLGLKGQNLSKLVTLKGIFPLF